MTPETLNEAFNKFAGKEVLVNEKPGLGISSSDKVLSELKKTAEEMGLIVRVLFPFTMKTQDFRKDRLNVYVDNYGFDGKYRIGGFKIG